jgi:eukaryotic-like serine/threonine-protein kinase
MAPLESEAARIFLEAVEHHEPHQWAEYVQAAAAGDRALVERVAALLKGHGQSNPMLDDSRLFEKRPVPMPGPAPGAMIGPYKLLEQIGEGGMGLVFMADQTQPVRRRVALKVVKPGMDTRQVVARFEAERQALAIMDHPHIAKVFDAGVTESGRPYFVMELVRGVAITEYCDERRLTTRQRLELFVAVCQAVQHAHQKGIIHRDLKPTNVLVTQHDTVAVPKIIDFGIAKATSQPLTELTLFTNFAHMLGTPLYMSPEQAEMNGLDVDTRSDVYSLGVTLYELLSGTTPFESETLKNVCLDEIWRMIREEEPPAPSRRFSTMSAQACSTISERRGVDGRRLGQTLRGELDWIAMKALEKDRDRRYESASALAADVQRYLNDEAVVACPPSAGYRLRKYARRNRRALVTVGIVATALVAATAVSTWQALAARDSQHQAEADRDRAEAAESRAAAEAAVTRAVNEFLQEDLIGQVAGLPMSGREIEGKRYVTVKEALDKAASRIGNRFKDQPVVEAAIQASMAVGYRGLYEFQLALPHFERAVDLRKTHLGLDHPDTWDGMARLSEIYMRLGRHADAIALSEQVLEHCKEVLGPDHHLTRRFAGALADRCTSCGQLEKSLPLWKRLVEQNRRLDGATHPATLGVMLNLAWNYGLMGRFEESLALFHEYYTLRGAPFGSPDVAHSTLGFFIQICQWAGKFDEVDGPLRQEIAKLRKDQRSVPDRNELGNHLGFLAVNLVLQGRYDEAEPIAREAVAKTQAGDGKYFYWVSALGAALLGQQKYAEAEPLLLQGYEGMKQIGLAVHPAVQRRMAEVARWIIRLYEATNQPEKARAWREKLNAPKSGEASE